MNDSEYWAIRFALIEDDAYKKSRNLVKEIDKIYAYTLANLEKDIDIWYKRFAVNNNITMAEARKRITQKEIVGLGWYIAEYIEKGQNNDSGEWSVGLENASAKFHISRLDAIKLQVQSQCESLFGEATKDITETMKDIAEESYYRTAYEIQKGIDVYFDVAKVNKDWLDMIIQKPWADDGSNFSQRIWGKYRPTLVNKLHKELADCIIRGDNPNNIATKFSRECQASQTAVNRLVYTEYSYFNSLATEKGMNDLGVEEFQVSETFDEKTCDKCQNMDGKHYPMTEFQIGVTAPPFHPHCRGTTVPYFDDEFTEGEQRAARDPETGKTYYTDAKDYKEWEKEFVKEKGQDEWDYYEKKSKNYIKDNEQWQNYRDVLGENAPKTLEEFQKLKYTDSEGWEYSKGLYRYLSTYPDSSKGYYDVKLEFEKTGTVKGVPLKPKPIQAFILPSGKRNSYHIMKRMLERGITDDGMRGYVKNAKCMISQWGGKRLAYYGDEGVAIVSFEDKEAVFKTAWSKLDFDETTNYILEVTNKYVK